MLVSEERKFRTLPSSGANSYSFIAGGDIGTTSSALTLLHSAAQHEPAFFLAGGDLSYANSVCACYRIWDAFFTLLTEQLVTPTGA